MPSEIRSTLGAMRESRRTIFESLQGIPESRMTDETQWAGGPMDVRFMFLRFADHEEEHSLQVAGMLQQAGFQQTAAQRILAAAELTRGDLLAALVGLTDGDLDVAPEGEWPLRQTLAHILRSEERYTIMTRWSADRFTAGQRFEWPPEDVLPQNLPLPLEGTLAEFISRLDAVREEAIESLENLPDQTLSAETEWADRNVDVRFRLMRFAHHEREHTAHILKWRRQSERVHTEAQHLLGLAWRARGVLSAHLVGVPDDLLDQEPANGDWPLRRLLEHITSTEHYLRDRILTATAPTP